jgi:hypothetical protein
MGLSEQDIKKLWGLAAGRCSRPGCEQECIRFLNSDIPTVIGEMAHVIAKQPAGPRGRPEGGEDTYENVILLCPTHHTEIDKAPEGAFPVALLHEWKRSHEERVRTSFLSPRHADRPSLGSAIKRLLIENKAAWQQYGPESPEAKRNPVSNLAELWQLRKLDTIVPNNRRIINLLAQNRELVDIDDYLHCVEFIEHAEGFELNCYTRTEGIPRFPQSFETVIDRYAGIQ